MTEGFWHVFDAMVGIGLAAFVMALLHYFGVWGG
jgi:hypothetical protein